MFYNDCLQVNNRAPTGRSQPGYRARVASGQSENGPRPGHRAEIRTGRQSQFVRCRWIKEHLTMSAGQCFQPGDNTIIQNNHAHAILSLTGQIVQPGNRVNEPTWPTWHAPQPGTSNQPGHTFNLALVHQLGKSSKRAKLRPGKCSDRARGG